MSDVLIEAGLVVGGLWDGAVVEHDGETWVVTNVRAQAVYLAAMFETPDHASGRYPASEVALRLPGPLGLGAAGLAVRIAERVSARMATQGFGSNWRDFARTYIEISALVPRNWGWLLKALGKGRASERLDDGQLLLILAVMSEYLAATDLIAEAAGLKLAAGEVARWTQTAGGRWMLSTDQGDVKPALRHCRALAGITDPHEALLVTWRRLCQNPVK